MTEPNQPSVTLGLLALQALISSGGWIPLPGLASALMFIRMWPGGSADALAVYSEADASAERTDATGAPVWRSRATLADVISALRELPSPTAVNAPRAPLTADTEALIAALKTFGQTPSRGTQDAPPESPAS